MKKKVKVIARVVTHKTFEYEVPVKWLKEWELKNNFESMDELTEDELIMLGEDVWDNFEWDAMLDENWVGDEEILDVKVAKTTLNKAGDALQPKTKFNFHNTYEERNKKRKAQD